MDEVRVRAGIVRGARSAGTLAWRGIPYAAPPVGPLRFRAPQPAIPWGGVRDCSRYGRVAAQAFRGQFRGAAPGVPTGEDCLTVNILTSSATPENERRRMPVMVFIHGGGYSVGSSRDFSGQGEGFVRSGHVLYVSFNYRLGALGYLDFTRYATPVRPIDSNLGLRDQVMALTWVRDNIASFGGDPGNVTVFGESAGANAVTTLMTTPAAAGLFARAIAQSSPANAVYTRELAGVWADEFVGILRLAALAGRTLRSVPDAGVAAIAGAGAIAADDTADDAADYAVSEPVTLLSNALVADLVAASLVLQTRTPGRHPGTFCLAPVVDGDFLPERPVDAFRAGRAHRLPLIIGTNDREGSVFRGRLDILPRSAGRIRRVFADAPAGARAPLRDAYPGLPGRRAAADFGGDFAFWYPSVRVADHHSRFAPVYVYRFDLAPRLLRLLGIDATHGVEMFALFDRDDRFVRTMTALGGREAFGDAGRRMREHWLQFAIAGSVGAQWPHYTQADRLTNIIDAHDRVVADPRSDRRRVWESFLPL